MARLTSRRPVTWRWPGGGHGQAPLLVVAREGDRVQRQVVGGSQRNVT